MNSDANAPVRGVPDAADDVPPDRETMFPAPPAEDVERKKDASVGIEDPRKEAAGPDGISAPIADER
jgi:hypothetical protein